MQASNDLRSLILGVAWLVVVACSTGCDDRGDDRAITTVKTVKAQPEQLDATSAQRFGYERAPVAPDGQSGSPTFVYETPTGFVPLPATPLRVVNFKVDGDSGVECYLSPVDSSDVAANVNRWRGQMRLEPQSAAAIEALPHVTLLGRPGTLVEIQGVYSAMGSEPKPDYGLLGIFAPLPMAGLSLKMIGPQAGVAAARERFLELANSLRMQWGDAAATQAKADNQAQPPGTDAPTQEGLRWTLPAGWSETKRPGMRLMTFTMSTSPNSECWLIGLAGDGGGLEDNLKRWRRELGQDPLSSQDVAQLPRIPMVGTDGVMIEVRGPYQGMSGPAIADAIMLGAICDVGTWTLFVKMVGPVAEMETQRAAFKEFCASLR